MDTTLGTRSGGAFERTVDRVLDNAAFAAVLSVMLASSAAVLGIIVGSP